MTPRSINRRQPLTLQGAGVGAAALGACAAAPTITPEPEGYLGLVTIGVDT